MIEPVISVENLSKRYLVGHRAERTIDERYPNFRDVLERATRNAVRKAADVVRGRQIVQGDVVEEFWALKDVSFQVQEGEILGIIGRNGAGKSTLLKILSRITEPTSGRITLRGRVASLLEVGTGFHPELTGRENIYLNGAILGMPHSEIRKKFDEIVDFAGIERFLDTPVKRYSSGMYVRLAFAVAAHLEPEILIVDEVLSVGDAEFQKKCLGKMDEVSRREGRTVLLVSHNPSPIRTLCERCILIEQGRIARIGHPSNVLSEYLRDTTSSGLIAFEETKRAAGLCHKLSFVSITLDTASPLTIRQPFAATLRVEVHEPVLGVVFGIGFNTENRQRVLTCDSDFDGGGEFHFSRPGEYNLEVTIPALPLWPARYVLDIGSRTRSGRMIDAISGFAVIEVVADEATPQIGIGTYPTACGPSNWKVPIEAGVVA
jgi:lipopolysaccharide transport system ATP-binding protein